MTRLSARCLVLLLVASLCFAVFTIGVSAADSDVSVSATFRPTSGSNFTITSSLSSSSPFYSSATAICQSLSITVPSAGTLIFSIHFCRSTFSLTGLSYSQSDDDTQSFVFTSTDAGTFSVNRGGGAYVGPGNFKISISSWTPTGDPEPPDPDPDNPGGSYVTDSSGGWNGWNSDGSYTPKPGVLLKVCPRAGIFIISILVSSNI